MEIEKILALKKEVEAFKRYLENEPIGIIKPQETEVIFYNNSITLVDLLHKQYELDELILTNVKGVTSKELLLSRIVAMLTEVGEWCNEEQSMKYWKKNKKEDREKEIEEFVDVLFFWLSIANLKGYSPGELERAYLKKHAENIKRQHNNY